MESPRVIACSGRAHEAPASATRSPAVSANVDQSPRMPRVSTESRAGTAVVCMPRSCNQAMGTDLKTQNSRNRWLITRDRTPIHQHFLILDFRFRVWGVESSLSELPVDVLKVKFPVVICPVLTVYFLTYMLLFVPSSVLFQKSCYFVRFRRTCLRGCLRPILEA